MTTPTEKWGAMLGPETLRKAKLYVDVLAHADAWEAQLAAADALARATRPQPHRHGEWACQLCGFIDFHAPKCAWVAYEKVRHG